MWPHSCLSCVPATDSPASRLPVKRLTPYFRMVRLVIARRMWPLLQTGGGGRGGGVAEISTEGGKLNTDAIGPDKDEYCYMRGTSIPAYGSNTVRFKELDWSQIDY